VKPRRYEIAFYSPRIMTETRVLLESRGSIYREKFGYPSA
jgi:hypothetical protein